MLCYPTEHIYRQAWQEPDVCTPPVSQDHLTLPCPLVLMPLCWSSVPRSSASVCLFPSSGLAQSLGSMFPSLALCSWPSPTACRPSSHHFNFPCWSQKISFLFSMCIGCLVMWLDLKHDQRSFSSVHLLLSLDQHLGTFRTWLQGTREAQLLA